MSSSFGAPFSLDINSTATSSSLDPSTASLAAKVSASQLSLGGSQEAGFGTNSTPTAAARAPAGRGAAQGLLFSSDPSQMASLDADDLSAFEVAGGSQLGATQQTDLQQLQQQLTAAAAAGEGGFQGDDEAAEVLQQQAARRQQLVTSDDELDQHPCMVPLVLLMERAGELSATNSQGESDFFVWLL